MSEKERNEAVEKIIGNMTAEMQNSDGQYVPLGFSSQPTEPLGWTQPPYYSSYNPSYVQYAPPPYTYMPPPYDLNDYNKNLDALNMKYAYEANSPSDMAYRNHNEFTILPDRHILREPIPQTSQNPTHLIENLVGNWVPNTSGTYSPFGNVEPFKPNVFEAVDRENEQNLHLEQPLDEKQFFNRNRKPRIVAEVKPMRPSYSDVLTKPVPPATMTTSKPIKTDLKDLKQKKDTNGKNNKSNKAEKTPKITSRSSNADMKDPIIDKATQFIKVGDSSKEKKHRSQLNRKWASLDNINDPFLNVTEKKKKNEETTPSSNGKCFIQKSCFRKFAKIASDFTNDATTDNVSNRNNETLYVNKNGLKKTNKFGAKPKTTETFGGNERTSGKRNQRIKKRENHIFTGKIIFNCW